MSRRTGVILFLLLAAVFLVVNRGAYKGYFQDDEIDNLSWAPYTPAVDYLTGVLTPRFFPNNFRPVGHFYFHEGERWFGLDFPKYVVVIQLLHLLNVWLVWMLARRLGAKPLAAAAGCVFFAFHMALFDAVWKPMYVFDVLCATFCLASVLFYSRQRWIWSFVSFWLAYKCKELAVMLPLVLACYELWFGKRRWKLLIPFFVVSLSFGLQGMLLNPNEDNDYTFRFTVEALIATSAFYAGRVFLVPLLGFVLPLAALAAPNRRTWFGLAMMGLFLLPLLFLPGRLFSAYCYVPFTGLALALAGVAEAARPVWLAVFFLLWLPADYRALRMERRATLSADDQVRAWMGAVGSFARTAPPVDSFVYDGAPDGFHRWGVEGALKYFLKRGDLKVHSIDEPGSAKLLRQERVALLTWDGPRRTLGIAGHPPHAADSSYLEIGVRTPVWQLDEGWYGLEGTFRWIAPAASAHLERPAGARQFELRVNVGPDLLKTVGPVTVHISLGGSALEPRRFAQPGWQTTRWDLAPAPAGPVSIGFQTEPVYPSSDPKRQLGIAVGGFGFR